MPSKDELREFYDRMQYNEMEASMIQHEFWDFVKDLDWLKSQQIREDKFWINKEEITVESQYHCFEEFKVGPNETVDFSANLSTGWGAESRQGNFWILLQKDGQEVAWSVDDRDLATDDSWQNSSVSLIYREKLGNGWSSKFRLCYTVDADLVGIVAAKGWWQYGYQIYGHRHVNVISDTQW